MIVGLGALTEGASCGITPPCAPGGMCSMIMQVGTVVNGVCTPLLGIPVDQGLGPTTPSTGSTTTPTSGALTFLQGNLGIVVLAGAALALLAASR